ncbi:Actin-binding LIM protein 3, partial [Ophiophagus hannah]
MHVCLVCLKPTLKLKEKIQTGIGRLILKEEMKARANSYMDPWTPPRSSASSREALHTAGYEGSLNGCKQQQAHHNHSAWCFFWGGNSQQ